MNRAREGAGGEGVQRMRRSYAVVCFSQGVFFFFYAGAPAVFFMCILFLRSCRGGATETAF